MTNHQNDPKHGNQQQQGDQSKQNNVTSNSNTGGVRHDNQSIDERNREQNDANKRNREARDGEHDANKNKDGNNTKEITNVGQLKELLKDVDDSGSVTVQTDGLPNNPQTSLVVSREEDGIKVNFLRLQESDIPTTNVDPQHPIV